MLANRYHLEVCLKIFLTDPKLTIFWMVLQFFGSIKSSFSPSSRISQLQKQLSVDLLVIEDIIGMFCREEWSNIVHLGSYDKSKLLLETLGHSIPQKGFVFETEFFRWCSCQIPEGIYGESHVDHLKAAICLSVCLLNNHRADVISHRLHINMREKIIDYDFYQLTAFEHRHSEGFLLTAVFLKFRDSFAQDLREMSNAGQGSDKVAVSQLSLLQLISIKPEGYLRFLNYLVCWHSVAENIILPLRSYLIGCQLYNTLTLLDLVQLDQLKVILVLVSNLNFEDLFWQVGLLLLLHHSYLIWLGYDWFFDRYNRTLEAHWIFVDNRILGHLRFWLKRRWIVKL